MKIEDGKFYRTRDGRQVGPMHLGPVGYAGGDIKDGEYGKSFHIDGTHVYGERHTDLVAEWVDGPVCEVISKAIKPGYYGSVIVGEHLSPGWVDIRWGAPGTTAPELRAAAATLTEIADALDEGAVCRA